MFDSINQEVSRYAAFLKFLADTLSESILTHSGQDREVSPHAGARKRGNQGRTPGTCRVGQAIFGDQVDEGLAAADDHKSPQFLTMNRGPGCGTY